MKNNPPIVQLQELSTGYTSSGKNKKISEKLNATLLGGKLVALLGPNGCGKSTLLRTMAGLQAPLDGSVHIEQIAISKLKSKEKSRLLSLVLTDKINAAHLIVEDIVKIGRYPYTGAMGILSEKDLIIVNQALEKCNLNRYRDTNYLELSDGERQRVMLARALAQDTPLMMLDEPTAHLDLPNRVGLMKMLRDLAKETGKAILLSTHELDLALQWCDTIWLMNEQGNLVAGVPEDLVLNGSFSKIFSNHSFHFDIASGTFKMNRSPQSHLYIFGNATIKEWTKRAVEREGFALSEEKEKADLHITITDNEWLLENTDKTAKNIAELLTIIKEIKQ